MDSPNGTIPGEPANFLAEGSHVSAGRILDLIRGMQAGVLPATVVVDHQAGKVRIRHQGEIPEASLKDKVYTRDVSGPYSVDWTAAG